MDEYEKFLEKHIADMANYQSENEGRSMLKMALHEYRAFKAKAEEPLAVLADRKGYPKTRTYSGEVWSVYIWGMPDMVFEAPTYAAAEQAAREYLNKLEDK